MLIYLELLIFEEDRDSFREIYEKNYLKMYHVAYSLLEQQADGEAAGGPGEEDCTKNKVFKSGGDCCMYSGFCHMVEAGNMGFITCDNEDGIRFYYLKSLAREDNVLIWKDEEEDVSFSLFPVLDYEQMQKIRKGIARTESR